MYVLWYRRRLEQTTVGVSFLHRVGVSHEIRLLDSVRRTFTCWTISPAQSPPFWKVYLWTHDSHLGVIRLGGLLSALDRAPERMGALSSQLCWLPWVFQKSTVLCIFKSQRSVPLAFKRDPGDQQCLQEFSHCKLGSLKICVFCMCFMSKWYMLTEQIHKVNNSIGGQGG